MNASAQLAKSCGYTEIFAPRVICKRYGGLLGPEYEVAVGDRCFLVGELTKTLLMSGTPLEDLDMLEIDPGAEEDE